STAKELLLIICSPNTKRGESGPFVYLRVACPQDCRRSHAREDHPRLARRTRISRKCARYTARQDDQKEDRPQQAGRLAQPHLASSNCIGGISVFEQSMATGRSLASVKSPNCL